MFGFSLAAALFQGPAQRTWNSVTQFTNLLWYKFNHIRHPIMPRSRRRHHSRSRSRSKSPSHDRDREPKRRKIDGVDSPHHKRSLSSEEEEDGIIETPPAKDNNVASDNKSEENAPSGGKKLDLVVTPTKTMSPKQLQKKLESEKKRQQKQQEREERERKRQEEKEQKLKLKQEKDEQKAKEVEQKRKEREEKEEQKRREREEKEEQKRKEREEKEAKRKEREERDEVKRKERELEKQRKQQEIEEKNKEKQRQEEQKQKAAAAFVNFFVKKTGSRVDDEENTSMFMPFQVKSDMRLAPVTRRLLSQKCKDGLMEAVEAGVESESYLEELKRGKAVGKDKATWPFEDDCVVIEEDFGERICEDKPKTMKMRAKFLKFHENKRPAYYGTWRKKSGAVTGRRPFGQEKALLDYDVDSDDDWEEEEQGESLNGSDDEEKENEADNDDYEVDNDFFVPHGHLSDDEVDDEAASKLSPESHKQKLKLLKDEFDADMQTKTHKIKPRSIGCIWYNKDGSNVDQAIDRILKPLAILTSGRPIIIKKRLDFVTQVSSRKHRNELREDLIPAFLKLINGNIGKKSKLVADFIIYMQNNDYTVEVSKAFLGKKVKEYAQWRKCQEEGPLFNKYCWCLGDEIKKKYKIE